MGRTFKDKRKFDRKQQGRDEPMKEHRREPKRRWQDEELVEDFDPYEIYDSEDYA